VSDAITCFVGEGKEKEKKAKKGKKRKFRPNKSRSKVLPRWRPRQAGRQAGAAMHAHHETFHAPHSLGSRQSHRS